MSIKFFLKLNASYIATILKVSCLSFIHFSLEKGKSELIEHEVFIKIELSDL